MGGNLRWSSWSPHMANMTSCSVSLNNTTNSRKCNIWVLCDLLIALSQIRQYCNIAVSFILDTRNWNMWVCHCRTMGISATPHNCNSSFVAEPSTSTVLLLPPRHCYSSSASAKACQWQRCNSCTSTRDNTGMK